MSDSKVPLLQKPVLEIRKRVRIVYFLFNSSQQFRSTHERIKVSIRAEIFDGLENGKDLLHFLPWMHIWTLYFNFAFSKFLSRSRLIRSADVVSEIVDTYSVHAEIRCKETFNHGVTRGKICDRVRIISLECYNKGIEIGLRESICLSFFGIERGIWTNDMAPKTGIVSRTIFFRQITSSGFYLWVANHIAREVTDLENLCGRCFLRQIKCPKIQNHAMHKGMVG